MSWIAFAIGAIYGTCLGLLVAGLCAAASRPTPDWTIEDAERLRHE